MGVLTGYRSPDYHSSYKENGSVEYIEGLPFLVRELPGGLKDAFSIYPFMSRGSVPWSAIPSILREKNISREWVATTIVTDPMELPPQVYDNSVIEKFRDHYIVDLQTWDLKNCNKNTRKNVRRLRGLDLKLLTEIGNNNSFSFHSLYQNTVEKYNIEGLLNFSKDQISSQIHTPGSVLISLLDIDSDYFDYSLIGDPLGTQFFYIIDDCAYWHISGYSPECARIAGSFLLIDGAIRVFKHMGLSKLVLGSGAGNQGLESFKKGFATEVKNNYIIKTVHDQDNYDTLAIPGNSFFPAYRTQI